MLTFISLKLKSIYLYVLIISNIIEIGIIFNNLHLYSINYRKQLGIDIILNFILLLDLKIHKNKNNDF